MNFNANFENIQQRCRICLKNGDINIWTCKISLAREPERNDNNVCIDKYTEKSFIEIMDIFFNRHDLMSLAEEFPLLCLQCLEDLKFCYIIYEKIKLASIRLKSLYQESLNQYIEEEHLIEVVDDEQNDLIDTNLIETVEENVLNLPQYEYECDIKGDATSKHVILDENDSFIVTQFIPEPLQVTEKLFGDETKNNDGKEFRSSQQLFTMSLKAVEVKDIKNINTLDLSQHLPDEVPEPAIYMCQYCPQAFAKADYLKTHIQKSHVCKFCTQSFILTEDLFSHIREIHTEHKCVICHKVLSSGTNLRHHIRRVHRIKLPAKVTLIDFIKSTSLEDKQKNETEILHELESKDIFSDKDYVWKNDDCVELLNQ